ncbi:hypothetical protein A9Q99_22540 [Gammaproteobacteria bacterium 45_16_T64]|nr:hypothetical protein A9Q99_22540 [Gammaproteobacteria bacterium 45_16_T64]
MAIEKGTVTYEAEGMEGGPFHSRVLHVPGDTSGLTIGRGYDMKEKSAEKITQDLTDAGVDGTVSITLGGASGLFGDAAKAFIEQEKLTDFEISMESQEQLFLKIYDEIEKDVRRICDKGDCVEIYGAVDWDNLEPKIRDIMIDLRYRGDYTPASRKRIQRLVSDNDLTGFTDDLTHRDNWSGVPEDRFTRRTQFLLSS